MKLPTVSPVVLSSKTKLPTDLEETNIAIPTHIVSNRLGQKGFIHGAARGVWLEPHPNWKPIREIKDTEVAIRICTWQQRPILNGYIPLDYTNPKEYQGWQILNTQQIIPEWLVYDKSDTLKAEGSGEFYRDLFNQSFKFELTDPNIKIAQADGSNIGFKVVGKLTKDQWEDLNMLPLPNTTAPYSRKDVVMQGNVNYWELEIPPQFYGVLPPSFAFNSAQSGKLVATDEIKYVITRADLLNLPEAKRNLLPNPLTLLDSPDTDKIILNTWGWQNKQHISMALADALQSGIKCKSITWQAKDTILIEPEHITTWPILPCKCQYRGKEGFICDSFQIDDNIWERSSLETSTYIYVTRNGQKARCYGIDKTLQKQSLKQKLEQIELILGPGYEEKYAKWLYPNKTSVSSLDEYLSIVQELQTGAYIKTGSLPIYRFLTANRKDKTRLQQLGFYTIEELRAGTDSIPLECFTEETLTALYLYSSKVDLTQIKGKLGKDTKATLHDLSLDT